MTETVLRYSLPNGTHVLIHQSALGGKEVANLPLIVVEDGKVFSSCSLKNSYYESLQLNLLRQLCLQEQVVKQHSQQNILQKKIQIKW